MGRGSMRTCSVRALVFAGAMASLAAGLMVPAGAFAQAGEFSSSGTSSICQAYAKVKPPLLEGSSKTSTLGSGIATEYAAAVDEAAQSFSASGFNQPFAQPRRAVDSIPLVAGSPQSVKISDPETVLTKFTFSLSRPTVISFFGSIDIQGGLATFSINDAQGHGCVLGSAEFASSLGLSHISLPAGSYTIDAFTSVDKPGHFSLGYNVVPDYDTYADGHVFEFESNGNAAVATHLDARRRGFGFLFNYALANTQHAHRDLDYYAFTLVRPSHIKLELNGPQNTMLALEDRNGNVLTQSLDQNGKKLLARVEDVGEPIENHRAVALDCGMLPAGTYYIGVVTDDWRAGGESYTVGYSEQESPFIDVNWSTPHEAHILWLAQNGVSKGWDVPGGREFRPYVNVARADMAAFLYRLVGEPAYTPSKQDIQKFRDVTWNTPHAKEIWWLASTGISAGWDMGGYAEFRPYAEVARADMAAFLFRLAGKPAFYPSYEERQAFSDVNSYTPHVREILWLASTGVSTGWDLGGGVKEFRPYVIVTRCDMAAFLHRMSDYDLLPAW